MEWNVYKYSWGYFKAKVILNKSNQIINSVTIYLLVHGKQLIIDLQQAKT